MAFLNKLFGKKDKNKKQDEEIRENEALDKEEAEQEEPIDIDSLMHDKDAEPIDIDSLMDDEDELTEEEIAAAERFEEEHKQEYENVTPLDYDGDFIDFEGMMGDDPEIEDEETSDESEAADETVNMEAIEDTEDEEETEEKESFWEKLKNGLSKTKKALFGSVNDLLKNFVRVDEDLLEELEELLIMADVGVGATEEIIDELRNRIKDGRLKEKDQVLDTLKEILGDMIGEHQPLKLETTPSVVLVIGVNGAGKTTSIGKISKRLRLAGKKVVVAAADTFRAAAIDQLEVWCNRAKVDIVKQSEGSDPAAVVFDAINYAKKKEADVLIIDTAGRLHNKTNLMNELAKINRVIDRELPDASRENLLVLDATTGQNAIIQAKEFSKAANITGITLNKLDGTAKGGIVISIKRELGIPVKFIGVGEKIDDMQEFDAKQFVDALFE
ncbi:MAG: signal recognition particle-docking protein FtsY [Ruminococcaceae bacterium]|nr:signal recognition particle-docking protein FtsY [Oscillospiraceae bacterium]